jgi:hypothetical protein
MTISKEKNVKILQKVCSSLRRISSDDWKINCEKIIERKTVNSTQMSAQYIKILNFSYNGIEILNMHQFLNSVERVSLNHYQIFYLNIYFLYKYDFNKNLWFCTLIECIH